MPAWPEFTDDPVDLEAASVLLAAAGDPVSTSRAPASLNAVWADVAERLSQGDDINFQRWLDALDPLLLESSREVSERVGAVVVTVISERRRVAASG